MLKDPYSIRRFALGAAMLAASCSTVSNAFPQSNSATTPVDDKIFWFSAPVALGADAYILHPLDRKFYLLACLDDGRFNRLQVSRIRSSQFVIDAGGHLWRNFPDELSFRVTATAIDDLLRNLDMDELTEPGDLNSFLLGLRFRLKIYRGLAVRILQPSSVRNIGMPGDEPSEERVYKVAFETSDIPVDDRIVLEVLSPGGQLLSRFHLELL